MIRADGKACRCPWCRRTTEVTSLQRISKMLRTGHRLSDESKATLGEIVRRATEPQTSSQEG